MKTKKLNKILKELVAFALLTIVFVIAVNTAITIPVAETTWESTPDGRFIVGYVRLETPTTASNPDGYTIIPVGKEADFRCVEHAEKIGVISAFSLKADYKDKKEYSL